MLSFGNSRNITLLVLLWHYLELQMQMNEMLTPILHFMFVKKKRHICGMKVETMILHAERSLAERVIELRGA